MKKETKILSLVAILLFTGCGSSALPLNEKLQILEVKREEKPYYFYYPASAKIEKSEQGVKVAFNNGCQVFGSFKSDGQLPTHANLKLVKNEGEKVISEAWYSEKNLQEYHAYYDLGEMNYLFDLQAYPDEQGIESCLDSVDALADSFTDQAIYNNESFGFKVDLMPDYKMEYMDAGEGVILKKWAEEKYAVEFGAFGRENLEDWVDLGEMLSEKYPGYTREFSGNGVYVDERSTDQAIRHYLMMSEDKKMIYEAYVKVPALHYSKHLNDFKKFASSLEVF